MASRSRPGQQKSAAGPSVLATLVPQTRATPTATNVPIRGTIWNEDDFTMGKKTLSSVFPICRSEFGPGPLGARAESAGSEPSDFLDVGGLETLGTASDVELDAVTLDQGLEALGLDGAVVD